ncbi:MAG: thiol:disulfide interchange protein DsbA/DsbL [Pseudomonadota bacterium]|nr:thiol:disulfide interchange protein DsbA/DsbL [Pseudomonadota bacterium]MED5274601.1 thiol:disulfide interchange protein DsbA/DsbL [Pseudomonadota bacterium]MED5429948.1 thiol:disulfide interchange protein DsbA/DsbL [Pseudomonadota bacterium]
MKKSIFLFLAITFSNFIYAENSPQKYVQISNSKQAEHDKIVIYEFFWYGCPHCFNIEPTIEKIESNLDKDTIMIKLPLALRESWMNHAKAFYSMQQMDIDSNLHAKIFEEIHINGNRLDTKSSLVDFIDAQGFDGSIFSKNFESFGTEIRIKKANKLARKYQITSVPTIVVNGKYLTSGSFVSSYDELYDVVNFLVEKERIDLK